MEKNTRVVLDKTCFHVPWLSSLMVAGTALETLSCPLRRDMDRN